MSKNGTAARTWAIIAAIFSMLQSLTWLGLSIAALALYYCEIPVTIPDQFEQGSAESIIFEAVGAYVYLVYFYNPECATPPVNATVGWISDATLPTAERTWQWSVAYIVVSGLWVLASLSLLVTGIAWCKGCSRRFFLGFWILVTLTVIVMDVVGTVQYGIDIGAVLDSNSLLALLQPVVTSGSELEKFINQIPETAAVIPSVVLTLAFSRCILVWAINVILWLGVTVSSCRHCSHSKRDSDSLHYVDPPLQQQQHQQPVIPAYLTDRPGVSASSTVRHDEFLWRGGPQQNHAYEGYDEAYDDDPGPIPQRHSYLGDQRDYEMRGNGVGRSNSRTSAELRGHFPWSYLQPNDEPPPVRPLSPHRRSVNADDWTSNPNLPQTSVKLPRATYTPSAPGGTNVQPNYYQFPYQPPQNPTRQYDSNIYLKS